MPQLDFHSPEEEIVYPLFKEKQIRFFMKRDDLIHPFISGNKWRKLKYNLQLATALNKKHLVTFGGAYSNHILATSCAGAKFGFKTTAFIRGEKVENEILTFCKMYGMDLIFVDRENYKNKHLLFESHFKDNADAYFINEGGAGKEAEKGCREIIKELNQTYDHIFCAAGTGTTSAGIINEIASQNSSTVFNMVPVLKGGAFLKTDISLLLDKEYPYTIHEDYHFGGYAKTQPLLIEFIKDFAAKTGILTDPVYTGKALYCIKDLAEKDFFKPHSKVLMIHTGGIFGILGMLNKFNLQINSV